MVTIATFNEPAKAKSLKTRFQQAGLHADVHNERYLQGVAFMSKPQANAKVMVEDKDFDRAQSLMIEWEATDPDIAAALIRCPQCGSSRIEYPQMTRKFLTPALVGAPLRAQNYSEGILLRGLPFHLDQRGRAHDRPTLASLLSRERIGSAGLITHRFQERAGIAAGSP